MLGCAAWLRWSLWRRPIMNPRRFATVAPAFCGTVVLAGWIVAWLAGFGSAGIENPHAVPIENRGASLAANAELADEPQAIAMGNPVIASADVATAVESVTGMATVKPAASDEPESIVEAALPDPSQVPSADLPPVQVATANPSDLVPNDAKEAVSSISVESVTGMATGKPAASDEPESIVVAALPDPSQMLPPDLPPV